MKKILLLLIAGALIVVSCSKVDYNKEIKKDKPTSYADRVSYSIGYEVGTSFARDSLKLNYEYFLMGIQKAIQNDSTFLTLTEIQNTFKELDSILQNKKKAKMQDDMKEFQSKGVQYKAQGDSFLLQNQKRPNVKTTPSGLQYEIIQEGNGPKPKITDSVLINERGMFTDEKEFDNTFKRNPVMIQVENKQIKAWEEALLMMPEGSRWMIYVPSSLAFGDKGLYPNFPPNAVLIFELELVKIKH